MRALALEGQLLARLRSAGLSAQCLRSRVTQTFTGWCPRAEFDPNETNGIACPKLLKASSSVLDCAATMPFVLTFGGSNETT
jgi:hypothetical protein